MQEKKLSTFSLLYYLQIICPRINVSVWTWKYILSTYTKCEEMKYLNDTFPQNLEFAWKHANILDVIIEMFSSIFTFMPYKHFLNPAKYSYSFLPTFKQRLKPSTIVPTFLHKFSCFTKEALFILHLSILLSLSKGIFDICIL